MRFRAEVVGARGALLAAIAAFVVYAGTLGHGFALDDLRLVRDNPTIRELTDLPQRFVEPYWPDSGAASGLHRPLTIVSLAVNRAVAGAGPAGFHLVNVLLHTLVAALAWFALERAATRPGTALVGSLLFAVHPIHVEAVANVAGRAELLAALGVLAAWLAHRRAAEATRRHTRRLWWSFAAAAYLAAVLSKEHAVVAPVLFWLDDRARARTTGRSPAAATGLTPLLAYGAGLAVAMGLRIVALGGLRGTDTVVFLDNPTAFASTGVRVATALWVQVRYVGLFLWPARLSSDYSHAVIPVVEGMNDLRAWCGVLAATVLSAGLLIAWLRRQRTVLLGLAIWVLFFLASANVLFPVGTIMAERLVYLPSLGACLLGGHALAALAARFPPRSGGRRLIIGSTVVALVLLGARTTSRGRVWYDNETLALHDVRIHPESAKLQAGAALAWSKRQRFAEAEQALRRAVEIWPDYAQAHFNLGQMLVHRGKPVESIPHLRRAAELAAHNPAPHKSLATVLERLGRREEALAAYRAGCAADPTDLAFCFNRARALLAAGRESQARQALQQVVASGPASLPGKLAQALLEEGSGQPDRAAEIYRGLLARDDLPAGVRRNVTERLSLLEGVRPRP